MRVGRHVLAHRMPRSNFGMGKGDEKDDTVTAAVTKQITTICGKDDHFGKDTSEKKGKWMVDD